MAGLHTYQFGGAGGTTGTALTPYPTADGSIRSYDGIGSCMLRGIAVSHTAPTIDTYVRARLSQQPAQDELEVSPTMTNDQELFGGPRAVETWDCPAMVGHDFDIKGVSAGSDNFSVGVFAQYGELTTPRPGARHIRRHIDRTTDVSQAWTSIGTISDLEPGLVYGIAGLRCIAEDTASLGIRLRLPGHGLSPGVPAGGYVDFVKEFGGVAAVVKGIETIDIEAYALADNTIDAEIDLVILGKDAPWGGAGGGAGQTYTSQAMGASTSPAINLGGIGGGIMNSIAGVFRA